MKEITQVQVIENEDFIPKADFSKEVYLLNLKGSGNNLDKRVHIHNELAESFLPSSEKFPQLLTLILKEHNCFDYEIITDKAENYSFTAWVCDREKIKVVSL